MKFYVILKYVGAAHYRKSEPYLDCYFFFNLFVGALGTAVTIGLLYQHRMIGNGDCGEIGGMKIGREDRNTRR
jgi:hypothetical protein